MKWIAGEPGPTCSMNNKFYKMVFDIPNSFKEWGGFTIHKSIVEADGDKPHRCPECWTIPDCIREHGKAVPGYIYNCDKCQTWWRIPVVIKKDILDVQGHVIVPVEKFKNWKFKFFDCHPHANWAHACQYIVESPDGVEITIEHNWPPSRE